MVLSRGALRELHRTLTRCPGPLLAAPRATPLLPAGWLARSYAEIWMRLPSVAGEVVGLGCYAVNSSGRQRWSAMPDVIADDAFVRARFAPEERVVIRHEHFVYVFPSGRHLLGVLARWRYGNREQPTIHVSLSSQALAVLARQPSVWRHLPAFVLVWCAVRLYGVRSSTWYRARR